MSSSPPTGSPPAAASTTSCPTSSSVSAALVTGVRRKGIEISAHDMLKSMPRGYPKDHPRAELLRHKGLITWRQWEPGAWLGTAQAKRKVVEFLRTSQPVADWLATHVGESTAPARERG